MTKLTFKHGLLSAFIFFLLISANAHAFTAGAGPNYVAIKRIYSSNVIKEKDVMVDIVMEVEVLSELSTFRNNFTVFFNPWERSDTPPATIAVIDACEGPYSGSNYDEVFRACKKETNFEVNKNVRKRPYVKEGVNELRDYTSYDIFVDIPPNFSYSKLYSIRINYTLPDYVFKQGDYYVLRLYFPNIEDKDIETFIVLPSNNSIPYRFPEGSRMVRIFRDNQWKWVFDINGGKDIFIWYSDSKELKQREEDLMKRGAKLGASYGLFFAFIFFIITTLITFYVGKRHTKNQFDGFRKIIDEKLHEARGEITSEEEKIVATINGKSYHHISCQYAGRFIDENKVWFNSEEEAQKEGKAPCSKCIG